MKFDINLYEINLILFLDVIEQLLFGTNWLPDPVPLKNFRGNFNVVFISYACQLWKVFIAP